MAETHAPATDMPPDGARGADFAPGVPLTRIKPTHRGFAPRDELGNGDTALAADEAWGQPIDDPPPIVEGFLEDPEPDPQPRHQPEPEPEPEPVLTGSQPSRRPARRGFLAPLGEEFPRRELPPAPSPPAPIDPKPEPVAHIEEPPSEPAAPSPAASTATDPIIPWWRDSVPPPAAAEAAAEARFDPVPAAVTEPSQDAAGPSRWGGIAQSARAWWPHQWKPIVAAAVVVALVVVAAGIFGVGPLGRLGRKPSTPVPAPAPVAAATPAPAPAPSPVAAPVRVPKAPDDPAARVPFYTERAKSGDADSALELAILYAKGEGVKQDYTQAATWFRAAAEHGVARAQYDLGVLCERGRGVPVNYGEAFTWYSRAAEGNFALAQYNLAVAYTRGQGTRQDFVAAAGWYQRAAVQGVVPAMVNLAILYERGEGVTASAIDAYAWYRAAAARGNQPSGKRAAELFDVLSAADRARAETRTASVLAQLPAASASETSPTLKSGTDADNPETGAAKPAGPAH